MTRPVKKKTRVQINATATQAEIVKAAGALFLKDGYAGTTLEKVAREAGVAPQTIYNAIGNKAALLRAVFEQMVSGPQAPRSVPEFMAERSAAAADAAGVVDVLADWFAEGHARMARLWEVVAEGAAHDDEVAALSRRLAHRRLANYGLAADDLLRRMGGAAPRLDREGIAAVIWSLGHPQVFQVLVREGGWSIERYRAWVRAALAAAIIGA